MNFTKLRAFSESPIPRRAIDYIKNQISMLDYDVVAKHGAKMTPELKAKAAIVKGILEQPNSQATWRTFIEMVVEDMLTIGHCPIEKRPWTANPDKPMVLYPFDAASLELYADWDGTPDKAKYAQVDRYGHVIDFRDKEIMYLRYNPRTNTPWGLSPLEVAAQTIDYLLGTQAYAGAATAKTTARKLIDLGEDIDQEQVKEFRLWWRDEVEGRGRTPIIGGSKGAQSIELGATNDEALFLKWQQFLIQQIANAFGMDSQKFGAVLASRATGDILDDATDEGAIRPLAHSIAAAINKEVIQELGFNDLELVFRWTTNYKDRKSLASIHQIYLTQDTMTIDEVRAELGLQPLPDGKGEYTLAEYRAIFAMSNTSTSNMPPAGVLSDEQQKGLNPGYNTPALQTKKPMNQTADPLKIVAAAEKNQQDKDTDKEEKQFTQAFLFLMLRMRAGSATSMDELYTSFMPVKDNYTQLTEYLENLYNDSWLASYNRRRLETGQAILTEVPDAIRAQYAQQAQSTAKGILDTYEKELRNRLDELIMARQRGEVTEQLIREIQSEIKAWLSKRAAYKSKQIAMQESSKAWHDALFAHDEEFAPETLYEVLPKASDHEDCIEIIRNEPYTLDDRPDLPAHPNCPHRYYAITEGGETS